MVDDSADLYPPPSKNGQQRRPASGLDSSSTSSSSSRPETPLSPRPTLTDALSQVAFSPKRPRTNQPLPPIKQSSVPAVSTRQTSRSQRVTVVNDDNTPVSRTRSNPKAQLGIFAQQSLSYAAQDPEVNVQPPTPDIGDASHFTKTAKGVNREIEAEMNRQRRYADNAPAQSTKRRASGKPAVDFASQPKVHPKVNTLRTPFRDKVHLPDVTGLTSAIASPARAGLEYLGYDAQEDAEIGGEYAVWRAADPFADSKTAARLVATLGLVQAKLAHLEGQNSISRRRVRELEMELEECKHEVARERTKVLEREEVITKQRIDVKAQKQRLAEETKAVQAKATEDTDRGRYKEVVEEQKGWCAPFLCTLCGSNRIGSSYGLGNDPQGSPLKADLGAGGSSKHTGGVAWSP